MVYYSYYTLNPNPADESASDPPQGHAGSPDALVGENSLAPNRTNTNGISSQPSFHPLEELPNPDLGSGSLGLGDLEIPDLVDASFLESGDSLAGENVEDVAMTLSSPQVATSPLSPSQPDKESSPSPSLYLDAPGTPLDSGEAGDQACIEVSSYDGQGERGSAGNQRSNPPGLMTGRDFSSNYSASLTLVNPSSGPGSPVLSEDHQGQMISEVNTIRHQFLNPAIKSADSFGDETRSELQLLDGTHEGGSRHSNVQASGSNHGGGGDTTLEESVEQAPASLTPTSNPVTVIGIYDTAPRNPNPAASLTPVTSPTPTPATGPWGTRPTPLPRMPVYNHEGSSGSVSQNPTVGGVEPTLTPPLKRDSGEAPQDQPTVQQPENVSTDPEPVGMEAPKTTKKLRGWLRSVWSKVKGSPRAVKLKVFRVNSERSWKPKAPKIPAMFFRTRTRTAAPPSGATTGLP